MGKYSKNRFRRPRPLRLLELETKEGKTAFTDLEDENLRLAADAMLQVRGRVLETSTSDGWGRVLVVRNEQLDYVWQALSSIAEIPVVDRFVDCEGEMLGSRQRDDGRVELFAYAVEQDTGVWGIANSEENGLQFEALYEFRDILGKTGRWRVFGVESPERRSSFENLLRLVIKRVFCARGVEQLAEEERS